MLVKVMEYCQPRKVGSSVFRKYFDCKLVFVNGNSYFCPPKPGMKDRGREIFINNQPVRWMSG